MLVVHLEIIVNLRHTEEKKASKYHDILPEAAAVPAGSQAVHHKEAVRNQAERIAGSDHSRRPVGVEEVDSS